MNRPASSLAVLMIALSVQTAAADQLTSRTVDAGGRSGVAVGALRMGFTIGQPDAQPVRTAGGLRLTSGFWRPRKMGAAMPDGAG